MTIRLFTTSIFRLAAVSSAFWLAGCASPEASMAPEQIVRAKAVQRIDAMVKRDMAALYALTAPSYRKLNSLETFRLKFGSTAGWVKGEVRDVTCQEQRCTVDLNITLMTLVPGRIGANIQVPYQEPWLLEDGKWWLYQGV